MEESIPFSCSASKPINALHHMGPTSISFLRVQHAFSSFKFQLGPKLLHKALQPNLRRFLLLGFQIQCACEFSVRTRANPILRVFRCVSSSIPPNNRRLEAILQRTEHVSADQWRRWPHQVVSEPLVLGPR
ncbi:hypothetical protein DEO72_LG5g1832 [Vigna unguiculata]|uniref:Uncharacterized protein n=1 Tax=Vigna unguiculata TaxID=3917 RepID=A0A4D6M0M5_VIGUN|nr:hypothetical protein DEO72_LG5g1832 [Vigna unguiculata]